MKLICVLIFASLSAQCTSQPNLNLNPAATNSFNVAVNGTSVIYDDVGFGAFVNVSGAMHTLKPGQTQGLGTTGLTGGLRVTQTDCNTIDVEWTVTNNGLNVQSVTVCFCGDTNLTSDSQYYSGIPGAHGIYANNNPFYIQSDTPFHGMVAASWSSFTYHCNSEVINITTSTNTDAFNLNWHGIPVDVGESKVFHLQISNYLSPCFACSECTSYSQCYGKGIFCYYDSSSCSNSSTNPSCDSNSDCGACLSYYDCLNIPSGCDWTTDNICVPGCETTCSSCLSSIGCQALADECYFSNGICNNASCTESTCSSCLIPEGCQAQSSECYFSNGICNNASELPSCSPNSCWECLSPSECGESCLWNSSIKQCTCPLNPSLNIFPPSSGSYSFNVNMNEGQTTYNNQGYESRTNVGGSVSAILNFNIPLTYNGIRTTMSYVKYDCFTSWIEWELVNIGTEERSVGVTFYADIFVGVEAPRIDSLPRNLGVYSIDLPFYIFGDEPFTGVYGGSHNVVNNFFNHEGPLTNTVSDGLNLNWHGISLSEGETKKFRAYFSNVIINLCTESTCSSCGASFGCYYQAMECIVSNSVCTNVSCTGSTCSSCLVSEVCQAQSSGCYFSNGICNNASELPSCSPNSCWDCLSPSECGGPCSWNSSIKQCTCPLNPSLDVIPISSDTYSFNVNVNGRFTTYSNQGYGSRTNVGGSVSDILNFDIPLTYNGIRTMMSFVKHDCGQSYILWDMVNVGTVERVVGVTFYADLNVSATTSTVDSPSIGYLPNLKGVYANNGVPYYVTGDEQFTGVYAGGYSQIGNFFNYEGATTGSFADGLNLNWHGIPLHVGGRKRFRALFSNNAVDSDLFPTRPDCGNRVSREGEDWPCDIPWDVTNCYADSETNVNGQHTCVTACSNSAHYSEDDSTGKCEEKPCEERTKNGSGTAPCGSGACYWDQGSEMGDNLCSSVCSNPNHFMTQESNHSCILLACELRHANGSENWPCGRSSETTTCFQDVGSENPTNCVTSCFNAAHYENIPTGTGKCEEKPCEGRTKNGSLTAPCGSGACYWDQGGVMRDNLCSTICSNPNHFVTQESNHSCILLGCELRHANSSTTWSCGLPSESPLCFQDLGGSDESACVTACTNTLLFEIWTVRTGKCLFDGCQSWNNDESGCTSASQNCSYVGGVCKSPQMVCANFDNLVANRTTCEVTNTGKLNTGICLWSLSNGMYSCQYRAANPCVIQPTVYACNSLAMGGRTPGSTEQLCYWNGTCVTKTCGYLSPENCSTTSLKCMSGSNGLCTTLLACSMFNNQAVCSTAPVKGGCKWVSNECVRKENCEDYTLQSECTRKLIPPSNPSGCHWQSNQSPGMRCQPKSGTVRRLMATIGAFMSGDGNVLQKILILVGSAGVAVVVTVLAIMVRVKRKNKQWVKTELKSEVG